MSRLIKNIFNLKYLRPLQLTLEPHKTFSSSPQNENVNLWVKSPEPDITLVNKTVPEFLWEKALQWGPATAFECGITGRKYSFEELYRHSRGFGASLIKNGIQRGDVISLVLPNLPEYPIALLGSLEAGLVVSTINPGYTPHEIVRQLVGSNSKLVVTLDLFLPAVLQARQSYPELTHIVVIGQTPEGCLPFFDMIKTDPIGYDFVKGTEIDPNVTAMLPYSSGTTGPPKGVCLTHFGLTSNVLQHSVPDVGTCRSLGDTGVQERFIGLLPFFHVAGFHGYLLYGVYNGVHTLTLPKFDPATFVQAFRQHHPTLLQLVPPLLNFLCQSPEIGAKEMEHVRAVLAGAAPIGEVLIKKMLNKFPNFILFQEGYGMTEMSGMIMLIKPSMGNNKISSCGSPLPSTQAKIIDVTTGAVLGPNQRGELCLKGAQMMKGYYKNEKATRDTIDTDGWLHTGDICYYDEDKCFYIVDRLKELIKVKGFQVAPSELEDLLREHPQIVDVAVIGVPDPESGEVPRAYIVQKSEDQKLTEEKIHHFLKDKVISYKQLVGGVEFVDAICKAPSGKILRRELLADFKKKNGIE